MKRAAAGFAVLALVLTGCAADVGSAGTVPPAPGSLGPFPSGVFASSQPTSVPGSGRTPKPTRRPTSATPRPTPASPSIPGTPVASQGGVGPTLAPTAQVTLPPAETPPATPAPTPAGVLVTEYFLLDSGSGPTLVPVPRAVADGPTVGAASLGALLAGPSPAEAAAGIVSEIPPNATVQGLSVAGGVASIGLSGEFAAGGSSSDFELRVAQVVYTLTQFPTITSVDFNVDGQPADVLRGDGSSTSGPVGRDDYTTLLPPIFVESPRWGEAVGNPIAVSGRANTAAGVVKVEVHGSDGTLLGSTQLTSSCGSNCWADFSGQVTVSASGTGAAQIVVSSTDESGAVIDLRTYALHLAPAQ